MLLSTGLERFGNWSNVTLPGWLWIWINCHERACLQDAQKPCRSYLYNEPSALKQWKVERKWLDVESLCLAHLHSLVHPSFCHLIYVLNLWVQVLVEVRIVLIGVFKINDHGVWRNGYQRQSTFHMNMMISLSVDWQHSHKSQEQWYTSWTPVLGGNRGTWFFRTPWSANLTETTNSTFNEIPTKTSGRDQ